MTRAGLGEGANRDLRKPFAISDPPVPLFEGRFGSAVGGSYDVAPDGARFLRVGGDDYGRALHVVLNRAEELKATRAP